MRLPGTVWYNTIGTFLVGIAVCLATSQVKADWFIDSDHSPCIDAGDDRQDSVGLEPFPNGGCINMGAYGGTPKASRSNTYILHVNASGWDDSYSTIQEAVDHAHNDDIILVWPGVYQEDVTFRGKAITVRSANGAVVIKALDAYAFSFYGAESSGSVVRNFIITNCSEGAVFCDSASPTLSNLTIVDNQFGITAYGGANPNITNCILWSNSNGDLFQCNARYSCIEKISHGNDHEELRNISENPLFADPDNDDYHLQSRFCRYSPEDYEWITDSDHSPCIDAGDPWYPVGSEPFPNDDCINMGAYGGTSEASRSRGYYIHVDSYNGSNSNGGRSKDDAFETIQRAVEEADDGDTILVWPGIYREEVSINDKEITLQSADDAATIEAPDGYALLFEGAKNSWSILRNFVITNCSEGAILCSGTGLGPKLTNLTIVNNQFGIEAKDGANPEIKNCIFWNNENEDLIDCSARYSCIKNVSGIGNIDDNPLFVDPDDGDYHLRSINGRYSP